MPAARDLPDLGHARVALLALVGSVRDRPGYGVVLLAVDDQQRAAVGVGGVDLSLGPGIEVGRRRLKQRKPWGRNRERVVQLLRLGFADRVRKCKAELLVSERDRLVAVGRVAQSRRSSLQGRDRQGQHTPKRRRVDRDRGCRESAPGDDLREQPSERVADDRRLLLEPTHNRFDVVGHLAYRLAGEYVRMGLRVSNRLRVVRPTGRDRGVALVLEQGGPAVPAARQQP